MLDDFDGQFADDISKLSKLKKKVVSLSVAVDVADANSNSNRMNDNVRGCCKMFPVSIFKVIIDM